MTIPQNHKCYTDALTELPPPGVTLSASAGAVRASSAEIGPASSAIPHYRAVSDASDLKLCSKCGLEKPLAEYQKNGRGGLKAHCKACDSARFAQYRAANLPEQRAYDSWYAKSHRQQKREYFKLWRQANPYLNRAAIILQTARRVGATIDPFLETDAGRQAVADLAERARYCAYCREPLDGDWEYEHVVPMCAGGEHSLSNLEIVCARCNQQKRRAPLGDWLKALYGD